MVKFLSNKKPLVKIGGVGTYTPAIKRLIQNTKKTILARFKSNKAIFDPGAVKVANRRRKKL